MHIGIMLKLSLAFCPKWIYSFYLLNDKSKLIIVSLIFTFGNMTTNVDVRDY